MAVTFLTDKDKLKIDQDISKLSGEIDFVNQTLEIVSSNTSTAERLARRFENRDGDEYAGGVWDDDNGYAVISTNAAHTAVYFAGIKVPVVEGESYTIKALVRFDSACTVYALAVGMERQSLYPTVTGYVADSWQEVSYTITANAETAAVKEARIKIQPNTAAAAPVYIKDIRVLNNDEDVLASIVGALRIDRIEADVEQFKATAAEVGGLKKHFPEISGPWIARCKEYAKRIAEASGQTENFLFFTDPHFGGTTDVNENTDFFLRKIAAVYDRTPVSMCVSGGDWLNNYNTKENACWQLGYFDGIMKELFDKYVMVVGNHDTNYQGFDYMESGKDGTYNREEYVKCILSTTAQSNLWNRKYEKSYFSFDGDCTKFYVFDTGIDWYPDMDEYRWEQVDWFANALIADKPERSAVLMHIATASSPMLDAITQIANAYNTRTSITLNDVAYDFTGVSGKIYFVLAGHTHVDSSYAVNGIPVITTINARVDTSDIAFDLVLADYDAKKIHMVRIGSGEVRVISLTTGELISEDNLFDIGTSKADYSMVTYSTMTDMAVYPEQGVLTAPSLSGAGMSLISNTAIENDGSEYTYTATFSNGVNLPQACGFVMRLYDESGGIVSEWENGWGYISAYKAFRTADETTSNGSTETFTQTFTLPENVKTFRVGVQFITPIGGEHGSIVTISDIKLTKA